MVLSEELGRELFGLLGVLGASPPRRVPRARCHGQQPSISVSSEKLRNVRIATIPASSPTLCGVSGAVMVEMMSADEQFQPQQNPSAKIGSIPLVGLAPSPDPQPAQDKKRCGDEHAANDDADTCELKKLGELVYKGMGVIAQRQFLAARADDKDLWSLQPRMW